MEICHRDLKLENFIFTNKGGEIKMIDFGFSKNYLSKGHMHEVVGTSYYIAPEVLAKDYTQKSDLWSLGVIFFMMLSGRTQNLQSCVCIRVYFISYSISVSVRTYSKHDGRDRTNPPAEATAFSV